MGGVVEVKADYLDNQVVLGAPVNIEQAVVHWMGNRTADKGCGGHPIEPQAVEGVRIADSGVH